MSRCRRHKKRRRLTIFPTVRASKFKKWRPINRLCNRSSIASAKPMIVYGNRADCRHWSAVTYVSWSVDCRTEHWLFQHHIDGFYDAERRVIYLHLLSAFDASTLGLLYSSVKGQDTVGDSLTTRWVPDSPYGVWPSASLCGGWLTCTRWVTDLQRVTDSRMQCGLWRDGSVPCVL